MSERSVSKEEVLSWLSDKVEEYRHLEHLAKIGNHGNDSFWHDRAVIATEAIRIIKGA